MTGKQQSEQEGLRAARPITIRALSILAAVAALAVSAAPVASAGPSKKPPPRAVSMGHPGFDHAGIDGHSTLMETSGEMMFLRGKAKAPRPSVASGFLDFGVPESEGATFSVMFLHGDFSS